MLFSNFYPNFGQWSKEIHSVPSKVVIAIRVQWDLRRCQKLLERKYQVNMDNLPLTYFSFSLRSNQLSNEFVTHSEVLFGID